MPKKTRKMKQRAAMRRSYQTMEAPASVAETEDVEGVRQEPTVRMRPVASTSRVVMPLTFDYSHIYGDLKRIALFAGFFFVVLIALSFYIK